MTSENLIGKSGFQATFDCQFTFPAVLCTCMVIWPTAPTMLKVFFPEVVYWQRTDEKCPFQGFGHECDFLLGTSVLPFVCNDTMIIIRSRMCVSLRHILNCPLFQCDLWGYGFSVCCCAFLQSMYASPDYTPPEWTPSNTVPTPINCSQQLSRHLQVRWQ